MAVPAKITRTWIEIEFSGDDLREVLIIETSVPLSGPDVEDCEGEWLAVINEAQRRYHEAKGAIDTVRIIPAGVRNNA